MPIQLARYLIDPSGKLDARGLADPRQDATQKASVLKGRAVLQDIVEHRGSGPASERTQTPLEGTRDPLGSEERLELNANADEQPGLHWQVYHGT